MSEYQVGKFIAFFDTLFQQEIISSEVKYFEAIQMTEVHQQRQSELSS